MSEKQKDLVTEARELTRTAMEAHQFARRSRELLRQLCDERLDIQRALASSVLNDPTEDDNPPYSTSEIAQGIGWIIRMKEAAQQRNAALRDQLAELQRRNDTQSESIMEFQAEEKSLKARLAQAEKERAVNLCGDVTHCATCAEAKGIQTMNTNERDERLRQIQDRFGTSPATWEDIGFLLSLIDSQAVSRPTGWQTAQVAFDNPRMVKLIFETPECAEAFIDGVEPVVGPIVAATRMREACVVAGKQSVFAEAVRLGISAERAIALSAKVEVTLSSLTLDQEKETREMCVVYGCPRERTALPGSRNRCYEHMRQEKQ